MHFAGRELSFVDRQGIHGTEALEHSAENRGVTTIPDAQESDVSDVRGDSVWVLWDGRVPTGQAVFKLELDLAEVTLLAPFSPTSCDERVGACAIRWYVVDDGFEEFLGKRFHGKLKMVAVGCVTPVGRF